MNPAVRNAPHLRRDSGSVTNIVAKSRNSIRRLTSTGWAVGGSARVSRLFASRMGRSRTLSCIGTRHGAGADAGRASAAAHRRHGHQDHSRRSLPVAHDRPGWRVCAPWWPAACRSGRPGADRRHRVPSPRVASLSRRSRRLRHRLGAGHRAGDGHRDVLSDVSSPRHVPLVLPLKPRAGTTRSARRKKVRRGRSRRRRGFPPPPIGRPRGATLPGFGASG